ncbi:MAG: IS66 family insertion sequence element accessory protein TnpB [Oscillospiraceae bacterium]|nr:IS66 family insertion sequence element accessory protein TnpB [Oscillospiraceae bacterium]
MVEAERNGEQGFEQPLAIFAPNEGGAAVGGGICTRQAIKLLLWENDGFVLLYKKLAVDGRYRWPRNQSEVKPLTWKQFDWLMSGLEIEQPKAIGTYSDVDNLSTQTYTG